MNSKDSEVNLTNASRPESLVFLMESWRVDRLVNQVHAVEEVRPKLDSTDTTFVIK